MRRTTFQALALLLSILSAFGASAPRAAEAAVPDVTLRFRPHCSASQAPQNEVGCQEFPLYDQETLITHGLKAGDTLDIDIVLTNPSRQPLQSVRSFLEYDPKVLKGLEVRIADVFPLVPPGEQGFSEGKGLVKLGASNVSGGMREAEAVFARVKFQVLTEPTDPVLLRFHEFQLLGREGKTLVLLIEEGRTVNVLKTRPKDLLLFFGEGAPPTTLPSSSPPQLVPPPPSLQPLPLSPPPIPDDGFSLLQPLNVRVTTEEDRVYLRWDPLLDPRVAGYNIYYGATSGRYIHRRTVARDTRGVTVRSLPIGVRTFFAVTAFDAAERESAFSYEVAVVVGDPESSTAPFALSAVERLDGPGEEEQDALLPDAVRERKRVPGATGLPAGALFVLFFVALGSSALLMRRVPRQSLHNSL